MIDELLILLNQLFCKHARLYHHVIHIYNKQDVIDIVCIDCGKSIYSVSIEEVLNEKDCHCCYCENEKK